MHNCGSEDWRFGKAFTEIEFNSLLLRSSFGVAPGVVLPQCALHASCHSSCLLALPPETLLTRKMKRGGSVECSWSIATRMPKFDLPACNLESSPEEQRVVYHSSSDAALHILESIFVSLNCCQFFPPFFSLLKELPLNLICINFLQKKTLISFCPCNNNALLRSKIVQ